MRRVALAFILALQAGLAPAAAQVATPPPAAVMDADELIARGDAAVDAGLHPLSEREEWTERNAGLDGTLAVSRRGDDTATESTLGPFREAHGTWHGVKWHQNDNGQTVLDRAEPSQTERVLTQTVSRVHDPLDAWQLTSTYASGHVTRLYYDPKTFEIVRSEKLSAGHTSYLAFDDFRTDAHGRTRYWHYSGGDDRAYDEFDVRLVRDDEDADIVESDVEIPRDRRALVEFPAGAGIVRLPARIDNDRIYVHAAIGGKPFDFLLDTGAADLSLDEDLARELKLTEYGRRSQTNAGTFTTGRVVVPQITIGPLVMHDVVMHTAPLGTPQTRDGRVAGLFGFDFLDALALRIDYANGTLDAARPGALPAPTGATPLDVRLNHLVPVAHAALGDASGDDFILDTGAQISYLVFQRFARAHPDTFGTSTDNRALSAEGVGGTIPYRRIGGRRVELGTWAFETETGNEALSPSALGFDNEDGLIGAEILKDFTIDLDYSGGRVYLLPNGRNPAVQAVAPLETTTDRHAPDAVRSNAGSVNPSAPALSPKVRSRP